ncbi:aldose epimerase family protein [Trichothermofontia sp.]
MFAIAVQPGPYRTYVLSDQIARSRLEVVPERGGMITRWQVQDHDLLYLDRDRWANPDLTVRGGIPILFPICGNLPDDTYLYQGKTYQLKQHGFARDLPWEVVEQVTDDRAAIGLRLRSNEQTRSVYPFEFEVNFTYQIRGSQLDIQQRFTNHSPNSMPLSFGLHPYFLAPNKAQLRFEIPSTQALDQRTGKVLHFAGSFNFQQEEIDWAFRSLFQPKAILHDDSRQLQLQLHYSSPYATLVFWTLREQPFVCLEPWTAPRNALNTGDHLLHLEAGATLAAQVSFSVS